MREFVVTLLFGVFAWAVSPDSAQARPGYHAILAEFYKDNAAIVNKAKPANLDKCNLCHDAATKNKKDHNEYGKALEKHMPAEMFKMVAADKEALAKKLREALKATEAEKHSSGKTFGEVITAGKLPGEK
ncbi:MAG: hypothetical protein ACR2FY_03380 [Pirellulaceae bacterium]